MAALRLVLNMRKATAQPPTQDGLMAAISKVYGGDPRRARMTIVFDSLTLLYPNNFDAMGLGVAGGGAERDAIEVTAERLLKRLEEWVRFTGRPPGWSFLLIVDGGHSHRVPAQRARHHDICTSITRLVTGALASRGLTDCTVFQAPGIVTAQAALFIKETPKEVVWVTQSGDAHVFGGVPHVWADIGLQSDGAVSKRRADGYYEVLSFFAVVSDGIDDVCGVAPLPPRPTTMEGLLPLLPASQCSAVGCLRTSAADGAPLQRCSRCMSVRYCSATCQRAHWKSHKPDCIPSTAS